MDFLALAQRVRSEAGLSGSGPASVASQTGEMQRVVQWTADGWRTLQGKTLWQWMWEPATVTIAAGTNSTAGAIPAWRYVHDSAHVNGAELQYMPWARFARERRIIGPGTPSVWTIRPDNTFVVDAAPAADTAIAVERYKLPTELVRNGDVPAMPEHLHMAIVWKALIEAADYDEAGATKASARLKYAELLGDLLRESTPTLEFGGPLL